MMNWLVDLNQRQRVKVYNLNIFMENSTWLILLPILILVAALWTLPWKGYALWKAARRGDKVWFVALLLINTLAILEILYIFVFSRDPKKVGEDENNIQVN